MLTLTLSEAGVRDAFEPVLRLGFSEPKASFAGTDLNYTMRRESVEVVVYAEDMGTNFPGAFVRQPDGSFVEVIDEADYPAHLSVWRLWWPLSSVRRWRLRAVLEQEVSQRVERLAAETRRYLASLS